MRTTYILSFFLALLYVKCQNKMSYKDFVVEEGKLYEVVYGLNMNQIISKHQLNKDSIWDGESKEFYQNGSLKTLSFYNNGKREGEKLTFFKDVVVKYFDILENDTVLVEHQAFKAYEFYDKNEDLKFVRKYNEKGGIVHDHGSVFVLDRINSNMLNTGEKFSAQFYLISPPNTESCISVIVYKNGLLIKTRILEVIKDYDAAFLEMPFINPGKYKIEIIGSVDDKLQRKVIADTLNYDLTVIDNFKKNIVYLMPTLSSNIYLKFKNR